MTCMVCGTSFEHRSWGSPAEPCECGRDVSREEWRSMDPTRFAEMKDEWRETLEQEATQARQRNERKL